VPKHIKLGDQSPDGPTGFPASLYPNLTYSTTTINGVVSNTVKAFNIYKLNASTAMLLGPFQVNETFSLVSMTLPIFNSTSKVDILGYMTVVAESTRLFSVQDSREGLDSTGMVLLLGPDTVVNKFPQYLRPVNQGHTPNRTKLGEQDMNFIFPPMPNQNQTDRHTMHSSSANYSATFKLNKYPVALEVFSSNNSQLNNAGSNLNTINEQGVEVAVGYARPKSDIVDWVLIVEESKAEAFAPVEKLRKILLGCIFGTIALILVVVVPTAHYSVLPITRLKEATEKSVQPPGYTPRNSMGSEISIDGEDRLGDEETANAQSSSNTSKRGKGFVIRMRRFVQGKQRKSKEEKTEEERRRVFKVPGKVLDPRHFITDELTELTRTFNEMSDELMTQYTKLEERVAERTRELEISKKAAEAANESKTLFIANISHELKTPLNGILGMCAVCMGEDDLPSIKRSLQVVYKSGDLLLHLLNDLLTFSKNQIGQSITIEEKEFVLSDIKSQVVTIFDKQVKEANIKFAVHFIGAENGDLGSKTGLPRPKKALPAVGPNGTGRLKDMRLWGDQHRILQVLINLVSNSLKFTPAGGRVIVRIKCIGEKDAESNVSRKGSLASKQGSVQRSSRQRHRVGSGSGSNASTTSRLPSSPSKPLGTALLINPMDPKAALSHIHVRERSPTPPPANSKTLIFEFEVEDTGPGIPASIQDRVFEPFVQGDLGLSRKYGGTGLGLSICHQLAGLMGGTITLENTGEGQGTTFNMQIPLKFVGERTSSTASSNAGGSRTPSVTSREDSRMVRLSLEMQSQSATNNISSQAAVVEKDIQPRLVGLSQPFFASAASADGATDDQLAILNRVATKPGSGKIRVLVAEDNLVNQEVVLRYVYAAC
jgi:osomolarity two-component system sensor histidine kinase SLN1